MGTVELHLESFPIEVKPRKLIGKWSCELNQKLQEFYATKELAWHFRCLRNARNVKKLRRKKYWVKQSEKYLKRDFRRTDAEWTQVN